MLKIYKVGDFTYQYEEGEQPEGAIEVKPKKAPKAKEAKPANKARTTKKKEA